MFTRGSNSVLVVFILLGSYILRGWVYIGINLSIKVINSFQSQNSVLITFHSLTKRILTILLRLVKKTNKHGPKPSNNYFMRLSSKFFTYICDANAFPAHQMIKVKHLWSLLQQVLLFVCQFFVYIYHAMPRPTVFHSSKKYLHAIFFPTHQSWSQGPVAKEGLRLEI